MILAYSYLNFVHTLSKMQLYLVFKNWNIFSSQRKIHSIRRDSSYAIQSVMLLSPNRMKWKVFLNWMWMGMSSATDRSKRKKTRKSHPLWFCTLNTTVTRVVLSRAGCVIMSELKCSVYSSQKILQQSRNFFFSVFHGAKCFSRGSIVRVIETGTSNEWMPLAE